MRIAVLAIAMLLAGCAAGPQVMRMEANEADTARTFPPPQTQEVPRYRYLGQLTGEQNFGSPNGKTGARKFFEWVVGLVGQAESPTVLQRPQTGVVDAAGRVLVTDVSRNAVFVFDEPGGKLDVWEQATKMTRFASPIGIALGPAGSVLVADAELGRVFRLRADGTPLGEFGDGVLVRPTGLARDAQRKRIYVADTRAHDIKVFDDDGKLLATWGSRGDGPGELNYPTHLSLANGTLYVTDTLNARVQGFDADGKPVLRFGQRGLYIGNLVRPKGVAADDEGNVYVIESMHDTLLVFDPKGQLLMSLGGTGQDVGRFYLPAGVWVDARNRVFVADMFNGRVAVFQFLGGN
ncbi:6-bladed beta-propeller [Ramlibacter albus]|uniref:6-bladed beta-propeller n=1 Tax=Ramlibacter albus TaxID=2079448 RepID=A0A923S1T4_9BURK|nr:6-bladed beta-propeller [Ramlibacter albus]MBC5764033.1 6-bladed beta-propeller [Ramlibacter albus]